MADGTRFKLLETSLADLTMRMSELVALVTEQSGRLTILEERPPPPPPPNNQPIIPVRLKFPRFSGDDPQGWIFQCEQFFDYHNIAEDSRVRLASFHLHGEALGWFRHEQRSTPFPSWAALSAAAISRFNLKPFAGVYGSFSRVHQTSTVRHYIQSFEEKANQTDALPPVMYLENFVAGLKPELGKVVWGLRPATLTDAKELALLHETSTYVTNRRVVPSTFRSHPQEPLLPTPPLRQHQGVKPLSREEMARKRELGLCFTCDAKWHRGHICRSSQPLLLLEDEESTVEENDDLSQTPHELSCVTLHSLTGNDVPRVLRLEGSISNSRVQVLIDSGSTLNFIHPSWIPKLGLLIDEAKAFWVTVGNGEKLRCSGLCCDVPVTIGDHNFTIDFYIIAFHGADIVLGVQWLRSLGEVTFNYDRMTVSFCDKSDQQVTLHGAPPKFTEISYSSLCRQASDCFSFFYLKMEIQDEPKSTVVIPDDIKGILNQFPNIFLKSQGLPPARNQDHKILLTPGSGPVKTKPYRYPHFQKEEISRMVNQMLVEGIIRPSRSPHSSPVILVRKKDGSWRFCVDYRALNRITVRDRFPIPTTDELFDELNGSRFFSKIDLQSGFHQIRLSPESIEATTFRTHDGHYEFLVMPFGLTNAPSTFQATMNNIFYHLLHKFVLVFFDDILIYSANWSDHLIHLETVFGILQQNSLVAKFSKCEFGLSRISYLGHVVSADGIMVDPSKISDVINWPKPTSVKQLRGFLGLTGYYRRFVQGYAYIAAPLTELLKKDGFDWSLAATKAFESLKKSLTTTPVLQMPDFSIPFTVETDASGIAMGAVLSQHGKPISFFSKKFSPSLLSSSVYAKEMEAIVQAVKKWRHYLLGQEFVILTDHRSLKHLLSQCISTPEQQKYLRQLLGFSYVIKYRPGSQNSAADALSRKDDITLAILSSSSSSLLDLIKKAALQDVEYKAQWTSTLSSTDHNECSIRGDFLLYKDRLVVPNDVTVRRLVFEECHSSPVGGHSGTKATLARLARSFYWHGMTSDNRRWIRECFICQVTKSTNHSPAGLLQPLPTPVNVWEDLSLDFIVSLPSSRGKEVILVVVDRLTKGAHFIGLSSPLTATSVATAFFQNVTKLHGIPRTLVSDRDPIFVSKFWSALFRLHGTKLLRSTSYHPQTDGQTEVVNRCLQHFLRCFVMDYPSRWMDYLHLAELWYNTSFHSSIGTSPFEATFGRKPPSLVDEFNSNDIAPDVTTLAKRHSDVLTLVKSNLQKAITRMKKVADQSRTDVNFEVGDFVLLRLQKHRQSSLARRRSNKLERKYFGPFEIIGKIGNVAYKLKLPDHSRIHNVFHVSLLKEFVGDPSISPPPTLPADILAIEDDLQSEEGGNDVTVVIKAPIIQPIKAPSVASSRGIRTIKAPSRLDL